MARAGVSLSGALTSFEFCSTYTFGRSIFVVGDVLRSESENGCRTAEHFD